jgi:hypothetical protein
MKEILLSIPFADLFRSRAICIAVIISSKSINKPYLYLSSADPGLSERGLKVRVFQEV